MLLHTLIPALPSGLFSCLKKSHHFLSPCPKVLISKTGGNSVFYAATPCSATGDDKSSTGEGHRPSFDLNLAVVLAGFAFEAYTSPPKDVGRQEIDAAQCQTVILSDSFFREMYDGQLFIKLRNGVELPAMDPWGTSDPYVIFQLEGQVAKSSVKWAMKDPTWNEDFTLNIKLTTTTNLQVAVWDANLVTSHKRMGNGWVDLHSLCDGNLHEVMVELEGIGGGGKIYFEVKYKSFDEIHEEKQWWRLPFVSDFFLKSSLGSILSMALESKSLNASQFVQFAFTQLKSLDFNYIKNLPSSNKWGPEEPLNAVYSSNQDSMQENENDAPVLVNDSDGNNDLNEQKANDSMQIEYFWKSITDIINQTIFEKLGVSLPEIKSWDRIDLLNKVCRQLRRSAEEKYVELGLATPKSRDNKNDEIGQPSINGIPSSSSEIKKASRDLLNQTETIFGALLVLATSLSKPKKDTTSLLNYNNEEPSNERVNDIPNQGKALDTEDAEDMRELFSSAESAMEAWAMLATSLGRSSFIKSNFEKICFLDNASTDTQVAIWRDSTRRRLVVAFRGTEQAKWRDLLTDLMLLPSGMNPERFGGDFKQEVQVHGGFLNAYDSVRNRILMLIKLAIGYRKEEHLESMPKWNVYVTGHSLGGALATLVALELSASKIAKHGVISVTMYNFGSPRVGNKRFTNVYNEKVKDSWRVVNHRDIIPTVPRLMGYCHVAQPVYLAAGDLERAFLNKEFRADGYEGDIIGEATPDVLVSEFMKGEKQLVEKILQTEINLLQSIRDGTALMQHMEDFYYATLLESVRSNYTLAETSSSKEKGIQPTT